MLSDGELLGRYLDEGSEEAFAALVQRHINLVYRAALRRVGGDAHSADDVVQKVFADLVRKAGSLRDRANLAGWLYTGTRFAAGEIVRAERRRRAQEQEAHTMHELENHTEIPGERLDPVLDEAMDVLGDRDREAVLLHFFEGLPFHAVGESLSLSADAARMRVNRSLDRLRSELSRRGIASTAAALTTALSAQVGFSAPAALASAVVRQALMQAGPVVGSATMLARLIRAAKSSPGLSSVGAIVAGAVVVVAITASEKKSSIVRPVDAEPALALAAPRSDRATESVTLEVIPLNEPAATGAALPFQVLPSIARPAGFAQLAEEEKTLLKQLWAMHSYYGETPGRAIAFNVETRAPRFGEFVRGRELLQLRGWVKVAPAGGVIFTPAGRTFGETYREEINAYPILFQQPKGDLPPAANTPFDSLTPGEKTLLKRLWLIDDGGGGVAGKRLGINVPADAPGFENFCRARDLLLEKKFVSIGVQKGVVLLQPAGRRFCEAHGDEIALLPLTGFVGAND